jgi:hypothetical protein
MLGPATASTRPDKTSLLGMVPAHRQIALRLSYLTLAGGFGLLQTHDLSGRVMDARVSTRTVRAQATVSLALGLVGCGLVEHDAFDGCSGDECAGMPCAATADCPTEALHHQTCLPTSCGGPPECRYEGISAGYAPEMLVCSCEGALEVVRHGAGARPTVFAHNYSPSELTLCTCYEGGEEACERSSCLGASCDAELEAPPRMTTRVLGTGLGHHGGSSLILFDAGTYVDVPEDRLILATAAIAGDAIAFTVAELQSRPTFLVDENADGACNLGEQVLRYARDFRPTEALVLLTLLPEAETIPCEERLPAR